MADISGDCRLMVALIYALKRYCQRQHSSRFLFNLRFFTISFDIVFILVIIELP